MPNKKKETSLVISCLISQIYWIAAALVLLLVICAVAVSLENPDKIVTPLTLAALYLSAVISGIAAVKKSGDGIASGALSGTFTAIILMILSFLPFPSSGFDTTTSLLCSLLVIPAAVLGAVLGHRKRNTGTFSARKRKKIR